MPASSVTLPATTASASPKGQSQAEPRSIPREEFRVRLRGRLPIAAALLLLLGICGGAAFLGIASQREAAAAAHEELIDTEAATIREQVLAAEAAQRGFLVTGRATYLAPFEAAVGPITAALDRLEALVAGDPVRAASARDLRGRVQRKLDEMGRTISLSRSGQPDAAHTLVNSDLGRTLSDEIKQLLVSLQNNVGDARHRATQRQATLISWLMVAIGLAAAGAILLAFLATLEARRHLRLLHKRENQLDRLVTSLEARVAWRTRALEETNQRFQIALESSKVTVFSQDADLVYRWISQSFRDQTPEQIVGRTDSDVMPRETAAQLDRLKRGVITSREPARTELRVDGPADTMWYDLTVVPTVAEDGTVTGLVGGAVDISDRKQFESHVRLLMRELTHRSKNLLAVIQALMRQTASHATSLEDFSRRFSARLDSLAGAHDLLIKDDWRGTTMEELVRSQLAHYTDRQGSQIDIAGPLLRVPPDATQNIGMALHELATNAAKYGALSQPAGQVCVHWDLTEDPQTEGGKLCCITWQESGGPAVTAPGRRGFGQVVIERTVARAVNGKVTLAYNPTGVEWTLVFPVRE
jgi:PAS domain S-box-containing protein